MDFQGAGPCREVYAGFEVGEPRDLHRFTGLPGLVNVCKKLWNITIFNGTTKTIYGTTHDFNDHFQ